MQSNILDQIAFGDRALRAIVEAMPLIHVEPKKHFQYAAMLHVSIVQLCGGCIAMGRTEHTAGIPVILRSMFEAVVDLDNLLADASYHERMDAANLDQFLKLLKESPTNPLLSGLDEKHDIAELATTLQAELDGLHARKRGAKTLRARCFDVGRENEYLSVYFLLCMDAHNNVAALVDRHVVFDDEQQVLTVHTFGDGDAGVLARRIFNAVGWMIHSAQCMHSASSTGRNFDDLVRDHEGLRAGAVDR